jgi:hypothetical protein
MSKIIAKFILTSAFALVYCSGIWSTGVDLERGPILFGIWFGLMLTILIGVLSPIEHIMDSSKRGSHE